MTKSTLAVEGIPVLFAHNMMYGVEWTPSALFAAEKRNIRIIAPSRPGFGFSDPLPGQDIDAVLDSRLTKSERARK